jgi:hypothetical protein
MAEQDGAVEGRPARRRDTRQQRGWYVYDWANSSFPTTVITLFFGPYLIFVAQSAIERTLLTAADTLGATLPVWGDEAFRDWVASVVPILTSAAASAGDGPRRARRSGGARRQGRAARHRAVPGAAVLLRIPVSAVIQILTLPILGAFVDRSSRKRAWLGWTAYLGAGDDRGDVPHRPRSLAARARAGRRREHPLPGVDRRLRLVPPRDRRRRRPRPGLVARLGARVRRWWDAARVNLAILTLEPFGMTGHHCRCASASRAPASGGRCSPSSRCGARGRSSARRRGQCRQAVRGCVRGARPDDPARRELPGDAEVPARVPAVQRRGRDGHHGRRLLRHRGARDRAGPTSCSRS